MSRLRPPTSRGSPLHSVPRLCVMSQAPKSWAPGNGLLAGDGSETWDKGVIKHGEKTLCPKKGIKDVVNTNIFWTIYIYAIMNAYMIICIYLYITYMIHHTHKGRNSCGHILVFFNSIFDSLNWLASTLWAPGIPQMERATPGKTWQELLSDRQHERLNLPPKWGYHWWCHSPRVLISDLTTLFFPTTPVQAQEVSAAHHTWGEGNAYQCYDWNNARHIGCPRMFFFKTCERQSCNRQGVSLQIKVLGTARQIQAKHVHVHRYIHIYVHAYMSYMYISRIQYNCI